MPGSLYLAGRYQGSPLSIAAAVPAVAGPFDLGTVTVQQGLDLKPGPNSISVKSLLIETGSGSGRLLKAPADRKIQIYMHARSDDDSHCQSRGKNPRPEQAPASG